LFAPRIAWRAPGAESAITVRQAVRSFVDGITETFDAHEILMGDLVEQGDRLIAFWRHAAATRPRTVHGVESVMDWRFGDGRWPRWSAEA
jgi:hypothetical protein